MQQQRAQWSTRQDALGARQDQVTSVPAPSRGLAPEQRSVGVDAHDCFALRDVTELTIELATQMSSAAADGVRAIGHGRNRRRCAEVGSGSSPKSTRMLLATSAARAIVGSRIFVYEMRLRALCGRERRRRRGGSSCGVRLRQSRQTRGRRRSASDEPDRSSSAARLSWPLS